MNGFRVIPFCILQLFCLCSIVAFCIPSFAFCNFVASVPCDFLLLFFSSFCCSLWLNIFFLLYDFLFCIPILQLCCLDPMITCHCLHLPHACTSIFASRKAEVTEISGIPKIPASPLTFIGFLNSGSGMLTLHRGQSSILEAHRKQPISWPQPVTQKYITAPQVCWQMTQVKTCLSLLTSLFDSIVSLISRNILFISDKSPV